MGTITYFTTERYGGVTRSTEAPHPVQRLANYLWKIVPIRASAAMGCDAALEMAPNVVPMSKHRSKSDAMASTVAAYCHSQGYHGNIVSDAIRVGLMRIKEGKSVATAIQSAKARADFSKAFGPKSPSAA